MILDNISISPFNNKGDLEFAANLTQKEGWHSETIRELTTFYSFNSKGCFIAKNNHEKIGMCIATAYKHTGFIGELIVDKLFRNQGVGKALMETCLSFLSAQNIETVFLDGVQKAVPLYQDLGFEPLYRSLRLFGQIEAQESSGVSPMTFHNLEEIFILDHALFGDDRSYFLRKRFENYPELGFVKKSDGKIQSYIFGRVGRAGWVTAGPWGTSKENENQLSMISHFQSKIGNQPFSIGILEPRTSILKELVLAGMHPRKDPPIRMKLGSGSDIDNHNQSLAIGSPAKG